MGRLIWEIRDEMTNSHETWIQWTEADTALTVEAGQVLLPHMPQIIESFYRWLLNDPQSSKHMPPEAIARVKGMQSSYWSNFFSGALDQDYAKLRSRVGQTHAVIGLPAGCTCPP